MSQRDSLRYRTLRFALDGEPERANGLCVSPQGRLDTVSGLEAVRQSLHLLLRTSPGERVMRPGFGCPLRSLVFSPNDATTAGLAMHYVKEAVREWEPRVEVLSVDAGPDPAQEHLLRIELVYRVIELGDEDSVVIWSNLSGGPS